MNLKVAATIGAVSCLLPVALPTQPAIAVSSAKSVQSKDTGLTMSGSPLASHGDFSTATSASRLNSSCPKSGNLEGFTKIYLTWNQIEPQKDKYDWSAVDAFMNQLNAPEEGLISLFSSSLAPETQMFMLGCPPELE